MAVMVLQGVSGSGKSTFARLPRGVKTVVVSADDYFMKGGVYRFDPSKLSDAHGSCLKRFVETLQAYYNIEVLVIVDNTSTTIAELAPYMACAGAWKHEAKVIRFDVDPVIAAGRNVHGVSAATVVSQLSRIQSERLPPWWEVEVVRIFDVETGTPWAFHETVG